MFKVVIHFCDDNIFVPEVVVCDSFCLDKSGNFVPLIRFFDSNEKEIKSISLTNSNFHVCGKLDLDEPSRFRYPLLFVKNGGFKYGMD